MPKIARLAGLHAFFVQKDQSKAILSIGPSLLQDTLHRHIGSELHDFLMEHGRFFTVTGTTLLDRQDVGPRTFLINRATIGFMSAIGDGLIGF